MTTVCPLVGKWLSKVSWKINKSVEDIAATINLVESNATHGSRTLPELLGRSPQTYPSKSGNLPLGISSRWSLYKSEISPNYFLNTHIYINVMTTEDWAIMDENLILLDQPLGCSLSLGLEPLALTASRWDNAGTPALSGEAIPEVSALWTDPWCLPPLCQYWSCTGFGPVGNIPVCRWWGGICT